jgi:hypothetical protein
LHGLFKIGHLLFYKRNYMNFILLSAILLMGVCNCLHVPRKESSSQSIDSSKTNSQAKLEMSVNSDYEPIPIDRLIGTADVIVLGNIIRLSDSTFSLQVVNLIAGNYDSTEIEIKQFHPDKFDGGSRIIPYKPGQSYLLFLKAVKSVAPVKRWIIMGIGGEGEMPHADNYVYFPGRNVEILNYGEFIVFGNKIKIQRYSLDLFIASIKDYRKCFKWVMAEKTSKTEIYLPSLICDKSIVDKSASASSIQKYIIEMSLRKIPK